MKLRTWHYIVAATASIIVSIILAQLFHTSGLINDFFAILGFVLVMVWAVLVIRGRSHIALKIGSGLLFLLALFLTIASVYTVINNRIH